MTINGKKGNIHDVLSISDLLIHRGIDTPETVSVELNGDILGRDDFDKTSLKENDVVEFLFFVGGGNKDF